MAFLLTMPGSYMPGKVWSFDKVGHFVMFLVFAYLWVRALGKSRKAMVLTAVFGILYGVGSELAQKWQDAERVGEVLDALANLLGVGSGLLLAARLGRPDSEGAKKHPVRDRNTARSSPVIDTKFPGQ